MKSKPSSKKPSRHRGLFVRRIVGESMQPTLQPGQVVVFSRLKKPAVGDIVMVSHEGLEKIKRIARQEHGRVYLLGDNPLASTDSRSFGWLGDEHIIGVLRWPKPRSQNDMV